MKRETEAASRKQGDILRGPQAEGREVSSRGFHRVAKNEWLDIVEESAPTQLEEQPISGWRPCTVGAPATSVCSLPINGNKWQHTKRLLGTSSLKEREMWHICSKQELWGQKKRPLPGNSKVTTRDSVFSMRSTPSSHSNSDARNNRGSVGSSVFYAIRAEAT
jgi:hypothetical protein